LFYRSNKKVTTTVLLQEKGSKNLVSIKYVPQMMIF